MISLWFERELNWSNVDVLIGSWSGIHLYKWNKSMIRSELVEFN